MSAIFSERVFFAPSFSGGPTLQYTVPTGKLLLVKCITITWGIVTITGVDAWVQDDGLTKLARYTWFTGMFNVTVNQGGTQLFYGSWAMPEGSSLYTQTSSGTVDFTCTGFLFDVP